MSEHVQSLERGLAVIRSFSKDRRRQTLSDVAKATGLTRATARRLLHTLVTLGYASTDGKLFELSPLVLDIGYSYLSSQPINEVAQPFLERLTESLHESSSASVLDDTDIVYVARVPTTRIMTVSIGLGSRFPAFQTSMGRVLLAQLRDDEVRDIFERSAKERQTPNTVRSADELISRLDDVRRQGWALVDQELELGVRSIAAPVRNASGRVVAAVNVGTQVGRTTEDEIHERFLPRLIDTAAEISHALGRL